jgi:hypothetical protein
MPRVLLNVSQQGQHAGAWLPRGAQKLGGVLPVYSSKEVLDPESAGWNLGMQSQGIPAPSQLSGNDRQTRRWPRPRHIERTVGIKFSNPSNKSRESS